MSIVLKTQKILMKWRTMKHFINAYTDWSSEKQMQYSATGNYNIWHLYNTMKLPKSIQ